MKKMIFIIALCVSLSMMQEARSGKNMKVMMKWQLTEYLDLEESQAEKFFPKMNTHEKELKNINKEIIGLKNKLEEQINSGTSSKQENARVIQKIKELEKRKIEAKYQYIGSLDGVLEPNQVSKLMVFDKKFKKSLKEQIRKVPPHKRDKQRR